MIFANFRTLTAGLCLLLFFGCSGDQSPTATAEGYLRALAQLDFEGASRYMGEDGRANFHVLEKLYADLSPEEQKKFQVKDWHVDGQSVTGDTATVDFTFDGNKKGQLSLKQVKNQWKIQHRQTL